MLLIVETHPVQYRCPLYQEVERIHPDSILVAYASDFSVRGYKDVQFGTVVKWDTPLLDGYPNIITESDRAGGITRFRGFSGNKIAKLIASRRPKAIMLCSFGYEYCISAYLKSVRLGIPIWLRMETQDNAYSRSTAKSLLRNLTYRLLYSRVSLFWKIGSANESHYLSHGVDQKLIRTAHYCTPARFQGISCQELERQRCALRDSLKIPQTKHVVSFVGKLIPKKDPAILFDALLHIQEAKDRLHLHFVGDGELGDLIKQRAMHSGISTTMAGFVNQSEIGKHYLATDTLVLPSKKAGETWGLVVNEALDAGCSVIVSSAAGCSKDFGDLERVRVCAPGDKKSLAEALRTLIPFERNFKWCSDFMRDYSVYAAASNIAKEIRLLT